MLYHSPFLQLLEQLPANYTVCIHQHKTLTAAELISKSKNLAAYLAAKGIKKGDHEQYTLSTLFQEAGFSNKTTFLSAFKKVHQCTPTEFIQALPSIIR